MASGLGFAAGMNAGTRLFESMDRRQALRQEMDWKQEDRDKAALAEQVAQATRVISTMAIDPETGQFDSSRLNSWGANEWNEVLRHAPLLVKDITAKRARELKQSGVLPENGSLKLEGLQNDPSGQNVFVWSHFDEKGNKISTGPQTIGGSRDGNAQVEGFYGAQMPQILRNYMIGQSPDMQAMIKGSLERTALAGPQTQIANHMMDRYNQDLGQAAAVAPAAVAPAAAAAIAPPPSAGPTDLAGKARNAMDQGADPTDVYNVTRGREGLSAEEMAAEAPPTIENVRPRTGLAVSRGPAIGTDLPEPIAGVRDAVVGKINAGLDAISNWGAKYTNNPPPEAPAPQDGVAPTTRPAPEAEAAPAVDPQREVATAVAEAPNNPTPQRTRAAQQSVRRAVTALEQGRKPVFDAETRKNIGVLIKAGQLDVAGAATLIDKIAGGDPLTREKVRSEIEENRSTTRLNNAKARAAGGTGGVDSEEVTRRQNIAKNAATSMAGNMQPQDETERKNYQSYMEQRFPSFMEGMNIGDTELGLPKYQAVMGRAVEAMRRMEGSQTDRGWWDFTGDEVKFGTGYPGLVFLETRRAMSEAPEFYTEMWRPAVQAAKAAKIPSDERAVAGIVRHANLIMDQGRARAADGGKSVSWEEALRAAVEARKQQR